MLSRLTKTDGISISGDISFNVNVAAVLSPEFQAFDDNIAAGRRGAMIVEMQKEDIFCDLASYVFAREFVQEKGYKICFNGSAPIWRSWSGIPTWWTAARIYTNKSGT